MVQKIRFDQLINSLDSNQQAYSTLEWESGMRLVVTRHGGRLMGPFPDESSTSLTWLPAEWDSADAAKSMIDSNAWNLGGERIWIAPEVQYNISDRANFWGTHNVPPAMDPGDYSLTETASGSLQLSQSITMTAYNLAEGEKLLDLTRIVQKAANPLRTLHNYEALSADVKYAGYQQIITLDDRNPDEIISETWDLVQMNPDGQLIIPASPGIEWAEYAATVPKAAKTVENNHIRLPINGQDQFKVGYKSAYLTGRLGYLNQLDDDNYYLTVRSFFNNPSAYYSEEPPDKVGDNGYSVHIYNDDGGFGGFGELECNGQAIGGATNRSSSTDTLIMWVYIGALEKLKPISEILLGVTL